MTGGIGSGWSPIGYANHKSTQDYFGHAIILSDTHMKLIYKRTTADGSEIWPSPIEVGSLSHFLEGFSNIPGGDRWISGTINSMS